MYEKAINGKSHYIFPSEQAFRKQFPSEELYRDWKEAPEGAWAVTDDGQVLEILKKGEMRKGKAIPMHLTYEHYLVCALSMNILTFQEHLLSIFTHSQRIKRQQSVDWKEKNIMVENLYLPSTWQKDSTPLTPIYGHFPQTREVTQNSLQSYFLKLRGFRS